MEAKVLSFSEKTKYCTQVLWYSAVNTTIGHWLGFPWVIARVLGTLRQNFLTTWDCSGVKGSAERQTCGIRWEIGIKNAETNQRVSLINNVSVITESWWLRDHSRWVFRKSSMEFSIGINYLLILLYKWLCSYYYTITCSSRTFYDYMTLSHDMIT